MAMQYYTYSSFRSPQSVPAQQQQKRLSKKLFIVLAIIVAIILIALHLSSQSAKAIDTHPQLAKAITSIIKANPSISIGVALIDLGSDDTSFTYGQTTAFTAASTTKVLTAAAFLRDVEQGTYRLTMPLGVSTAGWQLQEMVNQSDNDSWDMLMGQLGTASLESYAHQLGLASYNPDNNTITPLDEARLLQKLYQHQLLNTADTNLLLSYMQNTNDETLIPAALPVGATVYHKYGELLDDDDDDAGNFVHDAAIISYQGKQFVLTIYTNKLDDLDITTRQQIIHDITGVVVKAETMS